MELGLDSHQPIAHPLQTDTTTDIATKSQHDEPKKVQSWGHRFVKLTTDAFSKIQEIFSNIQEYFVDLRLGYEIKMEGQAPIFYGISKETAKKLVSVVNQVMCSVLLQVTKKRPTRKESKEMSNDIKSQEKTEDVPTRGSQTQAQEFKEGMEDSNIKEKQREEENLRGEGSGEISTRAEYKNLIKKQKKLNNQLQLEISSPKQNKEEKENIQKEIDQCQHKINKYLTKMGRTPSKIANYKLMDPQDEMTEETEKALSRISSEELSRQGEYLANTYDGKNDLKRLFSEAAAETEMRVVNGTRMEIPIQLAKDVDRSNYSLNGEKLESIEQLINEFGEEGVKKLGTMMNQALFGNFMTELAYGRKDSEGRPIDAGLGFGIPKNMNAVDVAKRVSKETFDENDLSPRYNIQKGIDGSVTLTGSLIAGFLLPAKDDADYVVDTIGGFCEIVIEIKISAEEFKKSDPKEMKLDVNTRTLIEKGQISDLVSFIKKVSSNDLAGFVEA